MPTTTQLTERYIQEHASVRYCLKKGLINYSALAREITKDIAKEITKGPGTEKNASKEAILIAARRFRQKISSKTAKAQEEDVIRLFRESNLEIKNNIVVFTLEKNIYPDALIDIEREIKKENALFFAIEGTKTITIIVQKQSKELLERNFKSRTISKKENLSLITLSSKGIWEIPGAVNYISGLFFENSINIEEFMSCHDDTLIVINSEDIGRIIGLLNF